MEMVVAVVLYPQQDVMELDNSGEKGGAELGSTSGATSRNATGGLTQNGGGGGIQELGLRTII